MVRKLCIQVQNSKYTDLHNIFVSNDMKDETVLKNKMHKSNTSTNYFKWKVS